MSKGLVFSIEEFSVFDGPGIRTSVFLLGCPLRCEWCHNPEGQSFSNYIVRSPNGCIGCGECIKHSIEADGKRVFSEDSITKCPNNLLRYCAKEYRAVELCERLSKNFAILNASGGGVTFSGGEPTASSEFLLECLDLLDGKTSRAVQTSGYCSQTVFGKVLERCDYMLFDVKLVDNAMHKKYTGLSNEGILRNLKMLASSNKNFVIRTPLIPAVTDTEENIRAIADLLSKNGINTIELLPYNKMTGSKYKLAGKKYTPSFDDSVPVCIRSEIFAEYGIEAKTV